MRVQVKRVMGSTMYQCIKSEQTAFPEPGDFPRWLFARTQLTRAGSRVARPPGNCKSSGYAAW